MTARVPAMVAVVAGASALVLTGCGEPGPNTAAVVNGTVITTSEAQQAATEINQAFKLQQPFTTQQAVAGLITAPFIIAAADKNGHPQSVAAAKAAMPKLVNPSPATIELYQASAAAQTLGQADQKAVLDAIAKADLQINPRFGNYDPTKGLVETPPNWIVSSSPSPSPSPSPSSSQG